MTLEPSLFEINLLPEMVQENLSFFLFIIVLMKFLLLVHWIVSTDFESKFNWLSLIIGFTGILYLHYEDAILIQTFEPLFLSTWILFYYFHISTWINNYRRISEELDKRSIIASLQKYKGSVLRFMITVPTSKNSSNQWTSPPFKNAIHVILMFIYSILIFLHCIPFFTPVSCLGAQSPLCCRYNYAIEGFETQSVHNDFCSGRVRIAFTGSWSTGKTSIITALLGHAYSTAQIAPAPTTDKFICLVLGAPYSDPVHSDDYELRRHCEMMSHVNEVTHKICSKQLPNVLDVADENNQFSNFVFFDMPGWQTEYSNDCVYKSFYRQLIEKMDYIYLVWDVHHGKIEEDFAEFFIPKARGTNYDIIFNRYEDNKSDMSFLNQQYSKMSNSREVLSEIYTIKIHENNTKYETQFVEDVNLLRAKIKSVNQTVYDNRKKLMKEKLLSFRTKMTGFYSLRKLKLADKLIRHDLNVHNPPKKNWLRWFGIEL